MKNKELRFDRNCHVLYSKECEKKIKKKIALHYPENLCEEIWTKVQLKYVEFLSEWRTDLGGKRNFHNGKGGTYDCIAIMTYYVVCKEVTSLLTYFGGLGLALLYNKKCVKAKGFFRIFPVLAYALPGFITMLGFKFMFSYGGPINYYITKAGGSAVGFLDIDAGWKARLVGLFVSGWMSIPSFMLYCSGILSNMNQDIHEAAIIDGASAFKRFIYLTLPFVIFATTPILISSFIGNFNNFGVFFFLRGGLYVDGYFLASDTDLLINWLYNLSISNNYYAMGAAISLVIFLFTSTVSLIVYILSPSYRKEETYQ